MTARPSTISIPPRLRRIVAVHLVANLRPVVDESTPLLLGVHGPSGEGKTYGIQAVMEGAGVHPVLVSGGQLESVDAGEPSQIIRDAYIEAGNYVSNHRPAALLLNDADAAIGTWGTMTQYTVNLQNVVTELMHLADYPTRVEGSVTRRVPVILTGNNFTRLYGPLCRPGRMRLCEWRLTDEERAAVLLRLTGLSDGNCRELLKEFPGRPIAFWASVVGDVDLESVARSVDESNLAKLLQELVSGFDSLTSNGHICSVEAVRDAARAVMRLADTNHLQQAEA